MYTYLLEKYQSSIESVYECIDRLTKKYILEKSSSVPPAPKTPKPNKTPEQTKIPETNNTVEPITPTLVDVNKEYIEGLIKKLDFIKPILLTRDYKKFRELLTEIIVENDYEDEEEIMGQINIGLTKYIIGSFTKVKPEDKKFLINYIRFAGYEEIPVRVGMSLKKVAVKFENSLGVITKNPNLDTIIKSIDRTPFVIHYGNSEELVLKGECVYYKLGV